jgi:hypothetical protein
MHCASSTTDATTAMRLARAATLQLLSPARRRERGKPVPTASAGSAIARLSFLRQPTIRRGALAIAASVDQPQAHAAAHAYLGNRSPLSQTAAEPSAALYWGGGAQVPTW